MEVLAVGCGVKGGWRPALGFGEIAVEEILGPQDHGRHLRTILLGTDDFHQATLAFGDRDVARSPGYDRIDADVLGFSGQMSVFYDFAVVTFSGHVIGGGNVVVGSIEPVDGVGIPRLLIGIVLDAVVAFPLLGNIPVAVTQHTFD